MPADFKNRGHRPEKKAAPGYVWLLSGLAIGLFVAFLVYLDKQPATEVSFGEAVKTELENLRQQSAAKKAAPKPETAASKPADDRKEPRFNFYTILPELEVLIPEDEIRPPEVEERLSEGSDSGKRYILQAGSFQSHQDAEKLKARLALLGMEASINRVTINSRDWHRVRIGPLNSHDLYSNMNLLQQNDMDAMAMELK